MNLIMWILILYLMYVVVGTIVFEYHEHLHYNVTIADMCLTLFLTASFISPIVLSGYGIKIIFLVAVRKTRSIVAKIVPAPNWNTIIIKKKVTEDDMIEELKS